MSGKSPLHRSVQGDGQGTGLRLSLFVLVALLSFGYAGGASAHILNEESQFPDIEATPARYDIVLLVGAGVIPQTPLFEPDRPLARRDLAAWAALASRLGEGGENPDLDGLAAAALDAGLLPSLEGEATYADLNRAVFDGTLSLAEPERVPSRAEAAAFIAAHLRDRTREGRTLLDKLGLEEGPTGPVVSVESETVEEEGRSRNRYRITVGDTTLPFHPHGRVANGPTDLLQWEGTEVSRSFIGRDEAGERVFTFLQAGVPQDERTGAEEPLRPPAPTPADASDGRDATRSPLLVYGIGALALLLAILLFARRRR